MKKINAYQCNFCKKIYVYKASCKSHEYKCYFNPRTKSCAGCTFLSRMDIKHSKGWNFVISACLLNHDVVRKLKTKCQDFADKNDAVSAAKSEKAKVEIFDIDKTTAIAMEYNKQDAPF